VNGTALFWWLVKTPRVIVKWDFLFLFFQFSAKCVILCVVLRMCRSRFCLWNLDFLSPIWISFLPPTYAKSKVKKGKIPSYQRLTWIHHKCRKSCEKPQLTIPKKVHKQCWKYACLNPGKNIQKCFVSSVLSCTTLWFAVQCGWITSSPGGTPRPMLPPVNSLRVTTEVAPLTPEPPTEEEESRPDLCLRTNHLRLRPHTIITDTEIDRTRTIHG
jgi:hypothetical protein